MRSRIPFLCALLGLTACADVGPVADRATGASSVDGYTMTVTPVLSDGTIGGSIEPGVATTLRLQAHDASGVEVAGYEPLHTMPLHLIAVSSSLSDFQHVHPELVTVTALRGQPAGRPSSQQGA